MFDFNSKKSINAFIEHAETLVQSRGKESACERLKTYYEYAKALACGYPAAVSQHKSWIAVDKDG